MTQAPKVAVIIPVYNGEAHITEAIQSVLIQTFQDFTISVVANGCTDKTIEIVQSFDDPRIVLRNIPKKIGVSRARNMGINTSNSKYITFLDADDYWHPKKLACQVDALDARPEAGLAYSWVHTVTEAGKPLHPCNPVKVNGYALRQILLSNFIGCGSNAMLKRSTAEHIGGFRTDVICAEDWEYWIKVAVGYSFACAPFYHIFYRQVPNSASSLLPAGDAVRAIKRVYKVVPPDFRSLIPFTIRHLRHYLVHKTLNNEPSRNSGLYGIGSMLVVARFFPGSLRRRWFWKVMFRALLYIIDPDRALDWCKAMPRYTDISGLTKEQEAPQ